MNDAWKCWHQDSHHGVQLAADITLRCALTCGWDPRPGAARVDGIVCSTARAEEERTYRADSWEQMPPRLLVALETRGQWSTEALELLWSLAHARHLLHLLSQFWLGGKRWSRVISISCARAFATSPRCGRGGRGGRSLTVVEHSLRFFFFLCDDSFSHFPIKKAGTTGSFGQNVWVSWGVDSMRRFMRHSAHEFCFVADASSGFSFFVKKKSCEVLDVKDCFSTEQIHPELPVSRKRSVEEQKAQKEDRFLRGRQIAFLI